MIWVESEESAKRYIQKNIIIKTLQMTISQASLKWSELPLP